MFQKILLAIDGSDNALRAARLVAQMVTKLPAQVTILSAVYVPPMYRGDLGEEAVEGFVDEAHQALLFAQKAFQEQGVTCSIKLVQDRHPADAILDEAQAGGYDLIALGSRGLSKREIRRLGSISQEVANQAPCSVLLVR